MTSNGLDAAIDTWLAAYSAWFNANAPKACDKPCCSGEDHKCEEE